MATVVLVGNGASMAVEPQLAVGTLTENLRAEFRRSRSRELREFAEGLEVQRQEQTEQQGFEDLLGPFDVISGMLSAIPGGPIPGTLGNLISQTREQFNNIYESGVGAVLAEIANRSPAVGERYEAVTVPLTQALAQLPRPLCLATLNYDALLLAALTEAHRDEFFDLARPPEQQVPLLQTNMRAFPLRRVRDFPDRRTLKFLQLHGSLAWLENADGNVFKFQMDDLRRVGFWEAYREGGPARAWRPRVVLTNSKLPVVKQWPFSFAYSEFLSDLRRCQRFAIIGYGFQDPPLNEQIRQQITGRQLRLLIVGRSDAEQIREQARNALVLGDEQIGRLINDSLIVGTGVEGLQDSPEWNIWRDNE